MIFVYKVERVTRTTTTVRLHVPDTELYAGSVVMHSDLEARAIAQLAIQPVVAWDSCEETHRVDLMERERV